MPEVETKTPTATDLSGDIIARLGAQRHKWRDAAKRLTDERDAARKANEKLTTDLAEAQKTSTRVAELEAKLKEQSHRAKFNELAKAAGVKEKAMNDLWEKSGYKPEGDEPDEKKIKAAIEGQQVERDYLFEAPAAEGEQTPETPEIRPAAGRGQGGTAQNNAGKFQATQAQLRDPAWCIANAAQLQKMSKEVAALPTAQVTNKFAIV